MPYLVIVFANNLELFSFDTEEDATRLAEEWWATFPDIKTLVTRITSENIIEGDLLELSRSSKRLGAQTTAVNPGDLDLLACLEHLVTEGGMDNFLEADRGNISMEFSGGKGTATLNWSIGKKKAGQVGTGFTASERAAMQDHQFNRATGVDFERYTKRVSTGSLSDLLAITRETCELLRDVFFIENERDWNITLYYQYYQGQ